MAQYGGAGDAVAAANAAGPAERLHHRPAECAVGFAVGQRAGIDLREVQPEDTSKDPFQLKAHHRELVGRVGAETVQKNDAVREGRVRLDVVEPGLHAVILATSRVAGRGPEEGVANRAVRVVDHADRVAGGRGSDVAGLSDELLAGQNVGAIHVFVERA